MFSVILAGGVGERFWPLSRRSHPKQLIDLSGKGSMIALTVKRTLTVSNPDEIFVVTLADQREAVVHELRETIPEENIIGEPVARNTAPSIGLAAVLLQHRFGDVAFAVLPADHIVETDEQFAAALRAAGDYVATHDDLLTFGIRPSRAETGYGYVRSGKPVATDGGAEIFAARSFHEKPTPDRAQEYVRDGSYYWNSGMFCWRTSTIVEAITSYVPNLYEVLSTIASRLGTAHLDTVLKESYGQAPRVSIDYGVMEKAENVVVMRGDFYWNDVGSWESVRDVYPRDEAGNVVVGDHVVVDSNNNTIFSRSRTIGVVGLKDIVIVDSGDAILVCERSKAQRVREVVEILKQRGKQELL